MAVVHLFIPNHPSAWHKGRTICGVLINDRVHFTDLDHRPLVDCKNCLRVWAGWIEREEEERAIMEDTGEDMEMGDERPEVDRHARFCTHHRTRG